MAVGLGNVDARTDGCRHGLFNEIHLPGAGLNAGIDDSTLFHLGNAGGDTDDNPGLEEGHACHLVDELPQHPLRHVIVGNNTLPQGTDSHDVAGGTAQHSLGLGAHLEQLASILIQSHHRGLVEDNALALYIYQNRCGTQIDTDILRHGHKIPPH